MAISEKLKAFLDGSNVKYTVAKHPTAYTAQEIAAAQHVPGRQLAKSVLINTDQGPSLAVLPAIYRIDLKKLKTLLGVKTTAIAKESDIQARFPDVEVGAMSPFGTLYQVPVVVERSLGTAEEIVFNGGSHTDTVKMRYSDFATLVKPKAGEFGQPFSGQAPARKRKKVTKTSRAKGKRKTTSRRRTSASRRRTKRAPRR